MRTLHKFLNGKSLLIGGLVSLVIVGCSKDPAVATDGKAPPKAKSPATTETAGNVAETSTVRRSVFAVAKSARDPFFPKSARTREKPAEGQAAAVAPVDLPTLLQDGFAGVMGNQERRLALVHNTILQAGKSAVIIAEANGKQVEIQVKCLEITRGSVTLQVQGIAGPVKLSRQRATK